MKKMLRQTIIVVFVSFSLISCKDWLQEDTRAIHVMKEYYAGHTALESGLIGVYGGLPRIFDNNSVGVAAVGTDVTYTTRLTSNIGPLDQYSHTPSTGVILNWYNKHFDVIQRANIVLYRGPNTPDVPENEMKRILAEARFLRAWAYFRLVQTFGRLPLVLEETADFDYRKRRDPIEHIYQAIINDLEIASEDDVLPKTTNGGHANHWAAKGLLAKVYLTLATSMNRNPQPISEYAAMNFDATELLKKSLVICDDIIDNGGFSLLKKYGDVFLVTNKNINTESIWEIQFSTVPGYGSQWAKQYGVYGNGANNIQNINAMVGTTAYQPVPSFYRYYKLGDARRTWNIADYHINYAGTVISKVLLNGAGMGDGSFVDLNTDDPDLLKASLEAQVTATRLGVSKYRWGDDSGESDPDLWWNKPMAYSQANAPNNVIVLRFADILLMRVEADLLINGGVSARSLSLMNDQILARARGVNPNTGAWYTEQETTDNELEPYRIAVEEAEFNLATSPENPVLQKILADAISARDAAAERVLRNYTVSSLTADEILIERARELCFEFHRWYDLVRTGMLKERVEARLGNPTSSPRVTIQENKHYLFPIPQKEIDMALDKNNFAQNPNY